MSCYHSQSPILATLQLIYLRRGNPRLPRWSRVGKEAGLQSFVYFHQLVFPPPHSFEVREASSRHLAATFVEMLWMCVPKVNSRSIVAARNFGSENHFTSPHAARYSSRFECTVRLRVLGGVDHDFGFLPSLDIPTSFAVHSNLSKPVI